MFACNVSKRYVNDVRALLAPVSLIEVLHSCVVHLVRARTRSQSWRCPIQRKGLRQGNKKNVRRNEKECTRVKHRGEEKEVEEDEEGAEVDARDVESLRDEE